MNQSEHRFFSYIESQIQDKGELYARFHLGTFCGGQALTVANALRRTLLAEIPGLIITSVEIEGAQHEFGTLPGVKENVLNMLLNIKKMAITASQSEIQRLSQQRQKLIACLQISGPCEVTAGDFRFPAGIRPLWPEHHIPTLGSNGILKIKCTLQCVDPIFSFKTQSEFISSSTKTLSLNTIPKPVRQVNYGIRMFENAPDQEYISLEIWTDGTIDPKDALDCALENYENVLQFYSIK